MEQWQDIPILTFQPKNDCSITLTPTLLLAEQSQWTVFLKLLIKTNLYKPKQLGTLH